MLVTIGEVINEIIPHAKRIEADMCGDFPQIKVYLSGSANLTRACLYIAQVAEHIYSAADTDELGVGRRYIFTRNTDQPFVLEKDFFDLDGPTKAPNVRLNMTSRELIKWFYEKMQLYGISRFSPSDLKIKFTDMGFTSTKIRRVIDRSFSRNHCGLKTIEELIDLVNKQQRPFSLEGLYEKEIRCIYAKLKNIGLIATITDDMITRIEFDIKR